MARSFKFWITRRGIVLVWVVKTKALISCAVTAQLICAFVFAEANRQFSYNAAHIIFFVVFSYVVGILLSHWHQWCLCPKMVEKFSKRFKKIVGLKACIELNECLFIYLSNDIKSRTVSSLQGFFSGVSGAEIRPHSQ